MAPCTRRTKPRTCGLKRLAAVSAAWDSQMLTACCREGGGDAQCNGWVGEEGW